MPQSDKKKLRPPVVVVMGHVDHGKTSLLDKIRKTNQVDKEVGQITQSIGASQISFKGRKITFIDTPGHEAFIKMRSRGAKIADLAVLVVAADDGVMPQTKESIKIINESEIPFLVAINKIDLPQASVDKVKGQLAENNIIVEGYGGKTVVVPVSAKTGEGINELLEMILLSAEMEELKADSRKDFEGVVIESKKDRFKGILVTILVKNGILRLGDLIQSEGVSGKVKAMFGEAGQRINQAEISQPVEVIGFGDLPPVGAEVVFPPETKIVSRAEKINKGGAGEAQKLPEKEEGKERLKIILRADSQGSLEAILNSLSSEVEILSAEVGEINESDILLAKTFSAVILSFKVRIPSSVKKSAQAEKVKIKNFEIIYDLLKEIEERVLRIIEPTIDMEVLGKAEILAEFEMKKEKIAGAKVIQGRINKADKLVLERESKIVGESRIKSLKIGSEDVDQVGTGKEFGIIFTAKVDFQKGDVIISHN